MEKVGKIDKMEKTKIIYVIGSLDIGGGEGQLVETVVRLNRDKFEPVIYCITHKGVLASLVEGEGIRVETVGSRAKTKYGRYNPLLIYFTIKYLWRLYRMIQSDKPDIVQGCLFHGYIAGTLTSKLAGVPIILSNRWSLGIFKEKKWHYLFLERISNRFNRLLITNSQAVREDVIRQEKVDPEKVIVIYNGVDTDKFRPNLIDPLAKKKELSLPPEDKVVGVIANLHHYKGHTYFLKAASLVKEKFPQVKFLLLGDGPERENLKGQAQSLSLEKDVLFLGVREDVAEILSIMDISVLPSFEEGFSNTILESMAAGIPMVATSVGGNPEAVLDGVTGFLVPPRDEKALAQALLKLLEDDDLRKSMAKSSRERAVENFGMKRLIEETEGLYLDLLNNM